MMRRIFLVGLLCFGPGLAAAQCNPTLPGTCAANDPVLFGLQQQQQQQLNQMQEINNQNLKLQQIERDNMRRYQTQTAPPIRTAPATPNLGVSNIIINDPPTRVRAKAQQSRRPVRRSATRRHRR